MDMVKMSVEHIYIGDGGLKEITAEQFCHYIKEQTVLLRGRAETIDFRYVQGDHENEPRCSKRCNT
jgi:hypothetical protein